MSIAHLLDHKAAVWRRSEATQDEFGAVVPDYALAYNNLACASDGMATVLSPTSQGTQPSGGRTLYFDIGPELQRRDLIEVYEGPTAPFVVEVRSFDPFRGHHLEVEGDEWNGKLPSIEDAS